MGVWTTPFESVKNAEKFAKILSRKQVRNGPATQKELFDIVGCDDFHDKIENLESGENIRPLIIGHVSGWMIDLSNFKKNKIKREAVGIVARALDEPAVDAAIAIYRMGGEWDNVLQAIIESMMEAAEGWEGEAQGSKGKEKHELLDWAKSHYNAIEHVNKAIAALRKDQG